MVVDILSHLDWPMNNNMVSKVLSGVSTASIHLPQFKFKIACKNTAFEWQHIRTHTKETPSKIINITFPILPFYQKKYSNCHPEYFWIY